MTDEEMKRALAVAETLETDEHNVTRPPAALRAVLRQSTPKPGAPARAPLDDAAMAKVRALRAKGMTLVNIAKAMGTTYYQVQMVR